MSAGSQAALERVAELVMSLPEAEREAWLLRLTQARPRSVAAPKPAPKPLAPPRRPTVISWA